MIETAWTGRAEFSVNDSSGAEKSPLLSHFHGFPTWNSSCSLSRWTLPLPGEDNEHGSSFTFHS